MTESALPAEDKAIQAVAQSLALDAPPPATLYEAVSRVRTWHTVMGSLSQVAAAQTMEAVCIIRDQVGSDEEFAAVIERELRGILQPDRALLMARTWAAARKRRQLRELAAARPDQAMTFVQEFVAAGRAEDLENVDADDEAVQILTLPPRQRIKAVRKVLDERNGKEALPGHEDPDSPDYLPGLQTAEERRAAEWRKRLQVLAEHVKEAESILGKAAMAAEQLHGEWLSERARKALLAQTDLIIGHAEQIAELATAAAPDGYATEVVE